MASTARTLTSLRFDNRAMRILPLDKDTSNRVRDPVKDACFSRVDPKPLKNPRMVAASADALALLGLPISEATEREDAAQYFGGNIAFPGAEPVANCYCGYQFGYFSGQLGDGAALTLGEVVSDDGTRHELQFKGSGKTPFSRTADGRKVLRSSLREFLCSEAMHALGIPTTRAGTVVTSDSRIVRDVFYSGRPEEERCSVITRIAPTFLRFGSFEIFKGEDKTTHRSGPSPGNEDLLFRMVDYVCNAFYADVVGRAAPAGLPEAGTATAGLPGPKLAGTTEGAPVVHEVYKEIVRRTARMVAGWQLVGWCHGVLNTDNLSIVGVTLDYGPFAFMDRFDWDYVCNTSDDGGRYTYKRQPEMCRWNCERLGEAWAPAMPGADWRASLAEAFDAEFERAHLEGARRKMGLSAAGDDAADAALFQDLLDTMAATGADFTGAFRALMALPEPADGLSDDARAKAVIDAVKPALASLADQRAAITPQIEEERVNMLLAMAPMDPRLKPHIPMLEQLAEAWLRVRALDSLTDEGKAAKDAELWRGWLGRWIARLGAEPAGTRASRLEGMAASNPRFVLRNYLCQVAIRAAEDGDFGEAQRLLARMQDPFGRDSSVPEELTSTGVELQRSGRVRGGNLVEMGDAPPAEAAAAASASSSSAGLAAGASCGLVGPPEEPGVATRYDSLPPSWACKLRVSCSS